VENLRDPRLHSRPFPRRQDHEVTLEHAQPV
jgi:hypothetical protein